MPNQQLTAISSLVLFESRLSTLVDLWASRLTGAELKLAVYL